MLYGKAIGQAKKSGDAGISPGGTEMRRSATLGRKFCNHTQRVARQVPMMKMRRIVFRASVFSSMAFRAASMSLIVSVAGAAHAQQAPWSQRMADTTMQRWPEGRFAAEGAPG